MDIKIRKKQSIILLVCCLPIAEIICTLLNLALHNNSPTIFICLVIIICTMALIHVIA